MHIALIFNNFLHHFQSNFRKKACLILPVLIMVHLIKILTLTKLEYPELLSYYSHNPYVFIS